ncbi:hypothetical protein IC235_11255 [Hymenobacter sp. BT664]|uniref:Uncharacterized protein n=1 Tax=Hymenobacter montanus TaxID=2771359 RepID=A0A927BEB0_9BACT|nr:hypothetical protein [Hymenobacter montanus]MBD2768467.1 hypothetical protein [Hymenobacter montanus]
MRPGSKQLLFFLTPAELVELMAAFESQNVVSYHQAGTFPSPKTLTAFSLIEEASLGHLTSGDWNQSPTYLISAPETKIVVREIILQRGGYSYAIDQQKNPDTVVFKPSGIFTEGILVAGSLVTGSSTAYSTMTFQAFAKIIKQRTTRIGVFYVGPDARAKLMLGWRLVTTASSPKEYDLALD